LQFGIYAQIPTLQTLKRL